MSATFVVGRALADRKRGGQPTLHRTSGDGTVTDCGRPLRGWPAATADQVATLRQCKKCACSEATYLPAALHIRTSNARQYQIHQCVERVRVGVGQKWAIDHIIVLALRRLVRALEEGERL